MPNGNNQQDEFDQYKAKAPATAGDEFDQYKVAPNMGGPTQFELDRPGKGITTEGAGRAAWDTLKQLPGSFLQMLDPTRGLSGAALSEVGLNPRKGSAAERLREVPIVQAGHEIASAYKAPETKWWEVPAAGLGSFVGLSSEREREHARRGEGSSIIGEAAVPTALTVGGPLAGEGLRIARPMLQRMAYKELPPLGAPTLTPKARAVAMLGGAGAGALATGGHYIGGHAGLLLGPDALKIAIGAPELGDIRNPGPFMKVPLRAPRAPRGGLAAAAKPSLFEGMTSTAKPMGAAELPPVPNKGGAIPFPRVQSLAEAARPTGAAAEPFEPLIWESPEEAAAHDVRMKNLERQAKSAGMYHAAQGATGKRLNLQQRIGRVEAAPSGGALRTVSPPTETAIPGLTKAKSSSGINPQGYEASTRPVSTEDLIHTLNQEIGDLKAKIRKSPNDAMRGTAEERIRQNEERIQQLRKRHD